VNIEARKVISLPRSTSSVMDLACKMFLISSWYTTPEQKLLQ